MLTYDVTVIPPDTTLVYDTFCLNELVADWNSIPVQTQTNSIYEAVLPDSENCDSVVILYTTIIDGKVTHDTIFACEEFTWYSGDGQTYTSSGTYLHKVGTSTCADSMWLHLVVSPPVQVDANVVDVLCYGDSTGSVNITVNGGIAPYRYLWSTGDTTASLGNLPAGDYSLRVSDSLADSLACEQTIMVTVLQPTPIVVNNVVITGVEITGESTGSIELSVSGGTPVLTFEWTDETGTVVGSAKDLYNQPIGDYTLTVTDANNCTVVRTFTIAEPKTTPCPEDLNLTCFEDLVNYPLATTLEDYVLLLTSGQVIDPGCGIDTSSFTSDVLVVTGSAFCYEEIRTYTLLDNCLDTIFNCEQHVVVSDTENPTMSCRSPIVVINNVAPSAYADIAGFIVDGGSVNDNCGIVSFRQLGSDVSDGGVDPEVITRVYEVADYCGNVATCTQQIEIYLSAAFDIDCSGLPGVGFECVDDLPQYRTVDDFRADGGYAFSYPYDIDSFWVVDVSNGRTCPEIINRTYYIRNENGDIESCTQRLRLMMKRHRYLHCQINIFRVLKDKGFIRITMTFGFTEEVQFLTIVQI